MNKVIHSIYIRHVEFGTDLIVLCRAEVQGLVTTDEDNEQMAQLLCRMVEKFVEAE